MAPKKCPPLFITNKIVIIIRIIRVFIYLLRDILLCGFNFSWVQRINAVHVIAWCLWWEFMRKEIGSRIRRPAVIIHTCICNQNLTQPTSNNLPIEVGKNWIWISTRHKRNCWYLFLQTSFHFYVKFSNPTITLSFPKCFLLSNLRSQSPIEKHRTVRQKGLHSWFTFSLKQIFLYLGIEQC